MSSFLVLSLFTLGALGNSPAHTDVDGSEDMTLVYSALGALHASGDGLTEHM